MEKLIKSASEAKELGIRVWTVFAKHGCDDKRELPLALYNKIKNLSASCPLCEWFKFDTGQTYTTKFGVLKNITKIDCAKCPLDLASHHCNSEPEIECLDCEDDELGICEICFNSRDYFTQWENAFAVFDDNDKQALDACINAANGILKIIEDWKI